MRCVACSWSRPSGASRFSFGSHLSSRFHHRSPLSSLSLSFPSSCDASLSFVVSSTSGPSDPKDSSNRSYSRRWYNPLPRRRHADQMPSSRIARDWIHSDTSTVSEDSDRFTVVSYNILGDRNSSYHRDLYSNVSFPYLKWGYRKRLICAELIRLRPDIICMQEVDKYFDLFSMMEKAGYAGSYKPQQFFRRTTYKYKLCNGSGELKITLTAARCFGRPTGFGFWRGRTLSLASLGCVTTLHSFVFSS